MKIILTSIITMLIALTAFAETPADSVKVYFRVGHKLFDPSFGNNGEAMDNFILKVKEAKAVDNIDYLTVTGCASPEGNSKANELLASHRCEEIANYIGQHADISSSIIKMRPQGVGWGELRYLVAKNPDVPYREKILYILDNTPLWIYNSQGKIVDGRKKQLMDIAGGRAWNWMVANIFPELRNAVAVVLYLKREEIKKTEEAQQLEKSGVSELSDLSDLTDLTDQSDLSDLSDKSDQSDLSDQSDKTDFAELSTSTLLPVAPKNFYMAIKTNMLFDAALIPNLGAEFYLGKNISIFGEWMYAWWENNARHHYWQTYGGDIGMRWWFGRKAHAKPLTGHHLGIYGGIFIFDFEYGDTGYLGGKPGALSGIGLSSIQELNMASPFPSPSI